MASSWVDLGMLPSKFASQYFCAGEKSAGGGAIRQKPPTAATPKTTGCPGPTPRGRGRSTPGSGYCAVTDEGLKRLARRGLGEKEPALRGRRDPGDEPSLFFKDSCYDLGRRGPPTRLGPLVSVELKSSRTQQDAQLKKTCFEGSRKSAGSTPSTRTDSVIL